MNIFFLLIYDSKNYTQPMMHKLSKQVSQGSNKSLQSIVDLRFHVKHVLYTSWSADTGERMIYCKAVRAPPLWRL